MRHFSTTLLFIVLISIRVQGQDADNIAFNLYQQFQLYPQEKVYLMTDKATYVAGEHIWFRAFLTDATAHLEDASLSRYVYVDLIDPNGMIVKHHMIRRQVSVSFRFRDLRDSSFLSIETVMIKVGEGEFEEFPARRSDGLSVSITGEVYDSDDQHIASIESLHAGMGSFFLLPQAGKSYYALCSGKDTSFLLCISGEWYIMWIK